MYKCSLKHFTNVRHSYFLKIAVPSTGQTMCQIALETGLETKQEML